MKLEVPTAFEALAKVVKNVLGDPIPLTPETLFEDLGADSLDIMEITIDIEHEFAIVVPDAEAEKFKTLGDAMAWLKVHADLSGYAKEIR